MKQNTPLVSIVLPVYNGEQFMEISIDSCRNQTYENWELLIVDDGSTDRSAEIAKRYEALDGRIHYHKNEVNLRLPRTLNRGFSLAKGDLLTWTSDDNYFRPTALEKMVNAIQKTGSEFAFAACSIINEKDEEISTTFAPADYKHAIWDYDLVGACFMYTRRAYEHIGDYDPNLFLCEDYDYWLRIFAEFPVTYIDENLYAYRKHDKALSTTHKAGQYDAVEKVLLKNFAKKTDKSKIDWFYLYRGLHRSRSLQKSWKEKYKYLPKLLYYKVWHKWSELIKEPFQKKRLNARISKNMKQVECNQVTILSQNCIGGIVYHDMKKQFLSPTINLYFPANDFLKFVNRLDYYLSLPLEVHMEKFPVGMLGDVRINFLHYNDCEKAKEDWNRRKERILRDKILVLCTDRDGFNDESYETWKKIKYEKLLFTSNKSYTEDSVYYPKYRNVERFSDIMFTREIYKDGALVQKLNKFK